MHRLVVGTLLAGACERGPVPEDPSLVLVSFDTLRADRVGESRGLMPNLDRFASEAVSFSQAYSQANETLFSHMSLFTGHYPSELGPVTYQVQPPVGTPLLAEVLEANGFKTGASVGGGFLAPSFGMDRGFQSYRSPREWGGFYHTVPGALEWLDTLVPGQRFFLFLHGYDLHSDYLKPAPYGYLWADRRYEGVAREAVRGERRTENIVDGQYYGETTPEQLGLHLDIRPRREGPEGTWHSVRSRDGQPLSPDDVEHVRGVYDGAASYADALFGLFMAQLQRRGLLDTTIVVVISDHGEELGERGVYAHRFGLTDESQHVPLMVRLPGGRGGGRVVDDLVGLVDVLPTLLDLAGVVAPAGIVGQSLVPCLEGTGACGREAVFSEGVFRQVSVRSRKGRLTATGLAADSPYLAEWVAAARLDGPGFIDGRGLDEATRAELRDELVRWRRALPPSPKTTTEVSRETLDQLRERGYWGVE